MMHDTHFVAHNAMLICLLAQKWAKANNVSKFGIVYMVGQMDVNIPVGFPADWPFFIADDDKAARAYFEALFPHTRHLLKIDLSKTNPHSAIKEI